MTPLTSSDSPSCRNCGMHTYRWLDYQTQRLRFIHPFFSGPSQCVHVGRVYKSDFTFAGWWADRDWMKTKGMIQ